MSADGDGQRHVRVSLAAETATAARRWKMKKTMVLMAVLIGMMAVARWMKNNKAICKRIGRF